MSEQGLEMDIDNRKLNRIFKDNPKAFGIGPDAFAMVSLRSDIADYIREVRIEMTMLAGVNNREDAEEIVDGALEATESGEIL
jgi:hypothetical protein